MDRTPERAAAYDSFYLAAAETLGCELWTADRRLVNDRGNQPWVKYRAGATQADTAVRLTDQLTFRWWSGYRLVHAPSNGPYV